ncbi:hypothetical protein B0H14DRAFT_3881972 [Mycena olivaceomarginata]|nr:hypothetical protein B0H14DRAFT_3881972 [Mycena olivaceomarginata]
MDAFTSVDFTTASGDAFSNDPLSPAVAFYSAETDASDAPRDEERTDSTHPPSTLLWNPTRSPAPLSATPIPPSSLCKQTPKPHAPAPASHPLFAYLPAHPPSAIIIICPSGFPTPVPQAACPTLLLTDISYPYSYASFVSSHLNMLFPRHRSTHRCRLCSL